MGRIPRGHLAASAPPTRRRAGPETFARVDEWILTLHPGNCEAAFEELTPTEYDTATPAARLLAHLLDAHDAGLSTLLRYEEGHAHLLDDASDLGGSLQRAAPRLIPMVLDALPTLEATREGREAARKVLQHCPLAPFEKVFHLLWPDSGNPPFPHLAGIALGCAAFHPEKAHLARALLEDRLEVAWGTAPGTIDAPGAILHAIAHAEALAPQRARLLEGLLEIGGVRAARRLATYWPYEQPHPVVVEATRLLLREAPDADELPRGLARCLRLDQAWSLGILEEWANGAHSHYHDGDPTLASRVQATCPREALDVLAAGALRRFQDIDPVYAKGHHRIVEDPQVILEWVEQHLRQPGYARYAASLIAETLSEDRPAATPDQKTRLRALASDLHALRGTTPAEKVRSRNRLGPKHEDQLAIALCDDVMQRPQPIDVERVIRILARYPHTRAALGGTQAEKYLRRGGDLPHARLYDKDIEPERERIEAEAKQPESNPEWISFKREQLEAILAERDRWETRFTRIAKRGIQIRPRHQRQLREKPEVWNEILLLDRLLDHFDEIDIEPKGLSGFGKRQLDFHLKAPEGELLLEVTTMIGTPDDLYKGVKRSAGDGVKTRLNSKLNGQLGGGATEINLPVVLAIFLKYPSELTFDTLNSLYGPLQVDRSIDKGTGRVARKGFSRGHDLGFLTPEAARCVPAVATLLPREEADGSLLGELHRGHPLAKHPLNPRLWVRLRDALFGAEARYTREGMSKIPGITPAEVDALVANGIDSFAYFAADLYPAVDYPTSIPRVRVEALQAEARRRQELAATGQVQHMDAAQGVDLAPLAAAGLHLARKLLGAAKPEAFPQGAWDALQEEARALYPPSRWEGLFGKGNDD